jgi:hypothetical protein
MVSGSPTRAFPNAMMELGSFSGLLAKFGHGRFQSHNLVTKKRSATASSCSADTILSHEAILHCLDFGCYSTNGLRDRFGKR